MLAPWELMWTVAIAVYTGCKITTWWVPRVPRAPLWKQAAYLFRWPGMDAASFLERVPISPRYACRSIEWLAATANLWSVRLSCSPLRD